VGGGGGEEEERAFVAFVLFRFFPDASVHVSWGRSGADLEISRKTGA